MCAIFAKCCITKLYYEQLAKIVFRVVFFGWLILSGSTSECIAENKVSISYSDATLGLKDVFCITITVEGEKVKQVSNFPEIADVVKSTTLYSKEKKQYIIKQYYKPRKKGTFELADFTVAINQKSYYFKGITLKVTSKKGQIYSPVNAPDVAYNESKPHCKLVIRLNKTSLWQSESILLTVGLQIYADNPAELNFVDLKEQLQGISNTVRPAKCWIQRLSSLKVIQQDTASKFNRSNPLYVLYEAYLSPMDTGFYTIPAIKFNMLKYDIFKTSLEVRRREKLYTLSTMPVRFRAMPLPLTLGNEWVAGLFNINESVPNGKFIARKAIDYKFTVSLKGTTGILPEPRILDNEKFDIFAPHVSEYMRKRNGDYWGSKTFQYTIVPKQEGLLELAPYIYWVYFNTSTRRVDTIRSIKKLSIGKNANKIEDNYVAEDRGDWDELFAKSNRKVYNLEQDPRLKWVSNVLIILMLFVTLYIILRK